MKVRSRIFEEHEGPPGSFSVLQSSTVPWVIIDNLIRTATGETLSGEVWYPTTAKSPYGGGTLLLTTYGLSDTARADLLARWSAWWKKTLEVIEIQPES